MFVSLICVTFFLHFRFVCSAAPDVRYRRRITLVDAPPTHPEESIILNTFELFSTGKIASDCTDLVFVHETPTQNLTLDWWPETRCPALAAVNPYTTIWIEFPTLFSALDDSFWLYYGIAREGSVRPVDYFRKSWGSSGAEIRLYASSSTIPTDYEAITAWYDRFLSPSSSLMSTWGELVDAEPHAHVVYEDGMLCGSATGVQNIPNVCLTSDIGVFGVPFSHTHVRLGTDAEISDVTLLGKPPAIVFVPTRPIQSAGYRYRRDIAETASYVGLFRNFPSGESNWEIDLDSINRFVAFGASPGQVSAVSHSHGTASYASGSWVTADTGTRTDSLESNSDPDIWTQMHDHHITDLNTDPEEALVPRHTSVHVYRRVATAVDDISLSSNVWMSEVVEMVYLFEGEVPPLGFVQLSTVSDCLVSGLPAMEIEEGFSILHSPDPHSHQIEYVLESVSPVFGEGILSDSNPNNCQAMNHWTFEGMFASGHGHDCLGTSSLVDSVLPETVRLIVARRYDSFDRQVSVEAEEELFFVADDPDPPGGDNKIALYAGIGAGAGVGLLVLVLIVLVLLCLCCQCIRKKNGGEFKAKPAKAPKRPKGRSDTPNVGLSPQTPARAEVDVQKELFRIKDSEIQRIREIGAGGGGAHVCFFIDKCSHLEPMFYRSSTASASRNPSHHCIRKAT